jgi:outer membrane protein TolC
MRRVLLICTLVAVGASPAAARRYTLQELIARVESEYPGVVAGRAGVDVAEAQLAQAQRLWLPFGDASFFITGSPNVQCGQLQTVNGVADTPVFSKDQNYRQNHCDVTNVVNLQAQAGGSLYDIAPIHGVLLNLSVNLIQPLYTFGKIEAAIGLAKSNLEAQQIGVKREKADVVFNAMRAYWGVKWARAAKATLDEGIDKLREWIQKIDDTMNGANAQKYTEGDLARLKVALDNAELLALDVKRGLRFAEYALKTLSNDQTADVDEDEIEISGGELKDLDYYQAMALGRRPEIKQLEAGMNVARFWRRLKLAEMLPDVALASNFTYGFASSIDSPNNGFIPRPNVLGGGFGFTVRQPLDIGQRYGRFQEARSSERAAAARRDQARGGIQIEIAKAHADVEEARGREVKTKHGEKVCRGWYNAVDQSLQAGLLNDTRELTDAARSYFDFRMRHLQSIFDANIAAAWLRRTTGVE